MAQPPQGPIGHPSTPPPPPPPPPGPIGHPSTPSWPPIGFKFAPSGRVVVANFLAPKALFGSVPANLPQEAIIDGADVYGTLPENLPFHSYNRSNRDGVRKVWSHFFMTRPTEAAASGRRVVRGGDRRAPLGCWRRYGGEKAYASEDGDVVGFRNLFAFYLWQDGRGKLTPWRMKEFRMNEGAAAFRGVAFHPGAKDLVVLKVYSEVEIPRAPPAYSSGSEDDDDDNGDDPGEGIVVGL